MNWRLHVPFVTSKVSVICTRQKMPQFFLIKFYRHREIHRGPVLEADVFSSWTALLGAGK